MFAKLYHNARDKAVGPELAAFLPVSTTPWYKKSELLYLNFCLISLFLLSSSNGYDGSMMNGLQALPQWHKFMDNPKGAWLGFINAAQVLGGGFMLPPIAWMSNRFGRKPTIALGYVWLFLGTGIQTGARNHAEFIAGRVVIGLATSHFAGCVPLLMTDIAYPTHRGIITCLFMCGWFVGNFTPKPIVLKPEN
jgi:MFS family permease